jgi:hypothetical protein
MAHTYNPSYSEGRDQKDQGLRSLWAKKLARPYFKKQASHGDAYL